MVPLELLLVVHAASTWFMVGLIWFVQVVHYPLMDRVGPDRWTGYALAHQSRTTFVVVVVMCVELASAILLVFSGAHDPPGFLVWMGLGLLGVVWVSTFAMQVPLHARLGRGFDERAHRMLVRSNWVRTLGWSARGLLAAVFLL